MFPFVPLLVSGAVTWFGHSWLMKKSLESPDYTPRFTDGGSDARAWMVGAGVAGLLFGPMFPLVGSALVGSGVAGLVSYDSTAQVKEAVSKLVGSQPAGLLEDQSTVEQLTTLLKSEAAEPVPE